jgi:FtsP/CotA-like multicopper oxidase with cupredoxin domain
MTGRMGSEAMSASSRLTLRLALAAVCLLAAAPARAGVFLQCPAPLLTQRTCGTSPCTFDPRDPAGPTTTDPGCTDPTAADFYDTCKVQIDMATGEPSGATTDPAVLCRAITCGDGHVYMADRDRANPGSDPGDTYIFGFRDVTNTPESNIMGTGQFGADGAGPAAQFSAPTLSAKEGQKLYLTLTNVGFRERPDLTDAHTVHYHGFPNAASVFDGEPMASFGIGMGGSLTYFYDNQFPGTYMWHCHVEAAEHMQMGMLGNLYIRPRQDDTPVLYAANGKTYSRFAYNDCPTLPATTDPMCGSTGYDVLYFLQEASFDPVFHNHDHTYQALDFANMDDVYPLFNGRGYPDTVDPSPVLNVNGSPSQPIPAVPFSVDGSGKRTLQPIKTGQRVLLRLTSLATTEFFTVTALGIPMRVVGQGAQLLRGPTGVNTSYLTSSVTLSGGEGLDVILDTTGVAPGTYFLYTTNLNKLSNDAEDFGGMMTEVVVTP